MNMRDSYITLTQIKVKEQLVIRKDMDVNEHERLSNITLRNSAYIVVLHFIVTIGSSIRLV